MLKQQLRSWRRCEELEARLLMSVAPEEQLFVYLLNRARHDPVAYQQENNLSVDLTYVASRGPLAVNNALYNSSEFHAVEMATHNYFGHQSAVTGDWPNKMARDAGYVLPSYFPVDANNIESIVAGTFYSNASDPLAALIVDSGVPSLGHRNHLLGIDSFNADNREIGVGHAFRAATAYNNYWAIHATRSDAADRFLTGVAFADANGNNRYDLNEGLANVTITVGALVTTTNAAGGWSIKVSQGSYTVSASGGGFSGTATATADVSADNVEVDFISGNSQGLVDFGAPPVPMSIADAGIVEGSGGTVNLVFTVTLASASPQQVRVTFSTANGTAIAGSDFQATSAVLTFSPGALARQVTVAVYSDLLVESNETFSVNLSNPVGATLTDAQATGTIQNDDSTYARPNEILVVAPGPGREASVRVLDRTDRGERFRFTAFPGFSGGVQVAVGDVNADGVLDIIAAAGPGGSPHVRVFSGTTGNVIREFYAYGVAFSGGVFVAAADFNGDNRADIVVAPGAGGGPHIRIFSGAGGLLGEYFAYAATFTGGVRVAIGDINGNGTPDVITGPGAGGGPHVRVFSGATSTQIGGPLGSFFAYAPTFTGGLYVAAGDVNADGRADVILGAGAGGGPHIRALSGINGAELASFFAYAPTFTGGVRVAAVDVTGDGRAEIVSAAGGSGGPHVQVFNIPSATAVYSFFAFEPSFTGGVYVAASRTTAGGGVNSGNLTALLPPESPPSDVATASDIVRGLALPPNPTDARTSLAARSHNLLDLLFGDVESLLAD